MGRQYYELYGGRIPPFLAMAHHGASSPPATSPHPLAASLGWLALAAWFGYTQFQRGLRWDGDELKSGNARSSKAAVAGMESFYRLPSRLFRDLARRAR